MSNLDKTVLIYAPGFAGMMSLESALTMIERSILDLEQYMVIDPATDTKGIVSRNVNGYVTIKFSDA